MILSILICSVTNRLESLGRLIKCIEDQIKYRQDVEILVSIDNKKRTVGEKRNDLIYQSQGRYTVFIDDDDIVESDYVEQIINKINEEKTDVVCFDAVRYVDGEFDKQVKYGVQYRKDGEDEKYYYRIPNHLMVFKRDISATTPYKFVSFGEDAQWAKDAFRKINTQATIDKVLYHYYFSPSNTETQK